MLSPSLEDYLEELYRFSLYNDIVRVTDISRKLNVSLPSVSKALRKLKAGQYINYQRYGIIDLTDKGKKTGNFLVERNKILQEFLTLICADCDIAAEAEAMEHYLSKQTIKSIQLLVKFMQDHTECYNIFLEYVMNQEEKEEE
ncbi:metal-dependent transcriptional regulator [Pelosinus fermentans]|jgi:Mn-dependent DtxR family transcriptional regulator|uniref:metal-dependent transcriptional regulator n=1 Tax=Pelosinus fermentans TaxID=365349 RepID=UPI0002685123|nr:iron dependent repressor, metal binding and dimerization domain protein [Pelosinus fermentans]EIW22832.1 iron (metal) dependent repressor, DtxR family [Pelosinus fermentans A11]